MAAAKVKGSQKLLPAGRPRISWKRLVILASVSLNIGFIVLWIGLASTYSLDGLFMADGLQRYCSDSNDDKFKKSSDQVRALRDYVCDSPDAHKYFQEGLINYLEAKGISRAISE